MPSYQVDFTTAARRDLAALPKAIRERVDERILALANNPRPPGVEKLAGIENRYRIRVGDFRVLYEIHDRVLIVTAATCAPNQGLVLPIRMNEPSDGTPWSSIRKRRYQPGGATRELGGAVILISWAPVTVNVQPT